MARSATWILLVSLTATPAAAQEAGSFSDLSRLVEAGDDVRVTLSSPWRKSLNRQSTRVAGVS